MKKTMMVLGLIGLMNVAPSFATEMKAGIESRQEFGSIDSFCRERLLILKSAHRIAEIESANGNIANSVAVLEKGLRDSALRINPRFGNTLTSKAIRRGLVLLENLKNTENSRQKLRAVNQFLFNYYGFIENVSNRLDIPYYQPGSGFSRIMNSNTQFENLFVNFAQDQVKMIIDSMSSTVTDSQGPVIYPIGSPTLLLTALKVTTAAMAADLEESIFAQRHACTIVKLSNVNAAISTYLATGLPYNDDFVATQELVGEVKRIVYGSRHCGGFEQDDSFRGTRNVIRNAVELYAGTTQQVRLAAPVQMKKLIVEAVGVRGEALFDVMVNGDVKGTIHVPGTDPSYIVTVNEFADSIELISRNGQARITKILVVAE